MDIADGELNSDESKVLGNLLKYGPVLEEPSMAGAEYYVIPRTGTISPWASKATDIAQHCGLSKINRIERGILYTVDPILDCKNYDNNLANGGLKSGN